jgi:aminocarboxymuconate-semialdehyde decarboxylase
MAVAIDFHAHVIVPELLRSQAAGEDWRPRVWREDGAQVVELGGKEIRSAVDEFVDLGEILENRRLAGIEGVVLCPWVPLLYPDAEPAACLERCRLQNDGLERLVRADSGRVAALGAVPMQEPELAAAELAALRGRGILAGVEVAASVGGAYLGEPRFESFWEVAEETGSIVFIHPTTRGFEAPVFQGHYLWNTVGNPLETTITAAQMVMAGVMERHPDLVVVLAHGGGALLSVAGRLRHSHGFQPLARADLGESPLDSIRRFHFDTVTHSEPLLRGLIEQVGAERVLLGSDYPFDMADPDPVGSVAALGLGAEAEAAILGVNARRLLQRAVPDIPQ